MDRRSFLLGAGSVGALAWAGCSSGGDGEPVAASSTTTASTTTASTVAPTTSTTLDPARSPFLQGPYAPVAEEVTLTDLEVTGSIPPELSGRYLRNGPNPFPIPEGGYEWFTGDGMLHGVSLEAGRARLYSNRWLRTEALATHRPGDVATGGPVEPLLPGANAANTNVVGHAGRTLALYEVGLPHEVGPELETLGRFDFGGALKGPMTAHPKVDPATGELHFFGYVPGLRYYVADAAGRIVRDEAVPTERLVMMHDFALSASSVVFFDLPVVFEPSLLETGLPFLWKPETGARVGVMRRDRPASEVVWAPLPGPSFVYHALGAFDLPDGRVAVDVVRHESAFQDGEALGDGAAGRGALPTLHRWTIDPLARTTTEEQVSDRAVEFPRADPRLLGQRHRYGYGVGLDRGSAASGLSSVLVRHDLSDGSVVEHDLGAGRLPGEAVFVPADEGAGEDEGWLLSLVLDQARGTTDLVVLDASDVAGPPVASVHLPVRVPVGFHGNWFPAA